MKETFEHSFFGQIHSIYNDYAYLEYYTEDQGKSYIIQEIGSQKVGEGKKIVQEFVKQVGPDKNVLCLAVIEKETRKRLSELGILEFVKTNNKKIELTTKALFKTLKITRLLTGGNLNVEKMIIGFGQGKNELSEEELTYPDISINILCRT